MKLCFASNNPHKILEVTGILGTHFQLLTLSDIGCLDELPETTNSIAGNAVQKAKYVFDHFGIPAFADDSGLEVDALNGEPGVSSAMFAGPGRDNEKNMDLLLEKMHGIENRSAQFVTVIALVSSVKESLFTGILKGQILHERRGKEGFGYDPLFLPQHSLKTLAEMSIEEKNKISHRAIATGKLAGFLLSGEGKKLFA